MGNINEYKKRFNTLMESTMGNVRPLISEQEQTSERPCVTAVKEIANAIGMELHGNGIGADLKKSDYSPYSEDKTKQYIIMVGCSTNDTTIGFTIKTGEFDPFPNDTEIENPLQMDIIKTMGDISFLGNPTMPSRPTDWGSVPVTPENTKKIIELIKMVRLKLGL